MPRKPKYVTYLDISNEEFNKMNADKLRSIVEKLGRVGNKRYNEFVKAGEKSPAFRYIKKSGGKFSAKGKNLNQLRNEYARVSGFLTAETGTVKGWQQVKKETVDELKRQKIDITVEQFDDFWESYEKLKELDKNVATRELKYDALKSISRKVKDTTKSPEEIALSLKGKVKKNYEARERRRQQTLFTKLEKRAAEYGVDLGELRPSRIKEDYKRLARELGMYDETNWDDLTEENIKKAFKDFLKGYKK